MTATAELAPAMGIGVACRALGVSRAGFYRRRLPPRARSEPTTPRAAPRALTQAERQAVREVLNSPRFVDQAPAQVHTTLLDEGVYHCSTRTMYRILDDDQEVRERRNLLRHPHYHKPELLATGPNQVWSWDITMLPGPAKASRFHLYVILDIFSRYVVGWLLARQECSHLAERLIRETCIKQDIRAEQLTIHSDRGPSMKSQTVAQLLAALGIIRSQSRPHVSNDNPFSESQFKTLKYRPEFPERFGSYEEARAFCVEFFAWYNDEHYHSGLRLLTPASVHYGRTGPILAQRGLTLAAAYAAHPERFVHGLPKPKTVPETVWINPPKGGVPQG
jgi:putative transposase